MTWEKQPGAGARGPGRLVAGSAPSASGFPRPVGSRGPEPRRSPDREVAQKREERGGPVFRPKPPRTSRRLTPPWRLQAVSQLRRLVHWTTAARFGELGHSDLSIRTGSLVIVLDADAGGVLSWCRSVGRWLECVRGLASARRQALATRRRRRSRMACRTRLIPSVGRSDTSRSRERR